MSYSTDRALQLSEVLKRFALLNAYQLASASARGIEPYELER